MSRAVSATLVMSIVGLLGLHGLALRPSEGTTLDGAYELVSETIVTTKPESHREYRNSDEWVGLWLFKNNYFSAQMMKKKRPMWISNFPTKPSELGYWFAAGTYAIEGNTIKLKWNLFVSPDSVGRSIRLEYQMQDDTLILTEKMHPYPERAMEGEVTTVLRLTK